MKAHGWWCTLALVVAIAPSLAAAEVSGDEPASDKAAVARELSDAGLAHFKKGDYDRALDAFARSYELVPEPALLFNIGQAHRKKGDCRQALDHYKRFSSADPQAATRTKVAVHIADMETCLRLSTAPADDQTDATTQTLPTPAPSAAAASVQPPPAPATDRAVAVLPLAAPPVEPVRDGRNLRIGGIAVGATGIVALALGVLASLEVASIEERVALAFDEGGPWTPARAELISRGRSYERASQILYAVGSLALLTGASLYYFGARQNPGAWRIAVAAPPSLSSGAVSLACTF